MDDDLWGMLVALRGCSVVKKVNREGWKRRAGIAHPESVADHIFSTTLAVMMVGDLLKLDTYRMMKMALLHDVCEAVTGDIQPGEMEPAQKKKKERKALEGLLHSLPEPLRKSYMASFDEFNRGSSSEAKLVKDLDKLEMVMQASTYEREGTRREVLEEFWRTADAQIKSEAGRKLFSFATSLRPRRSAP
ncbi:MAG: HD domain-containing protein [Conexivisphaerales archaeon]